jgi:hypothetical protein
VKPLKSRKVPTKLSDLILMSVDDAIRLSKRPGFRLNMAVYHDVHNGVCNVCLGGAAMVGLYGIKQMRHRGAFFRLSGEQKIPARVMDAVRCGMIRTAVLELDAPLAWDPIRHEAAY